MELSIDFRTQMAEMLPPDELECFLKSLQNEPSVSVRINNRKTEADVIGKRVGWCGNGRYLDGRRQFTFDPLLHAGLYYVQDASSMFIREVIRQIVDKPVNYLDLCAAPGGKTTAAIDSLGFDSLIVSNEIDRQRSQILRENVIKWGMPNCMVLNESPAHLGKLSSFFDVIAADMPCSGEGMFRKDSEAVTQWSLALVKQCAERQKSIAADIWNALKPGGYFIYSTCTYNRQENEEILKYIIETLGAESVDIDIPSEWRIKKGIDTDYSCYRFMPHLTEGEGLFMAVVRKVQSSDDVRSIKIKHQRAKGKNNVPQDCYDFLRDKDDFIFTEKDGNVIAIPQSIGDKMKFIGDNFKTLHYGIPVAQIKGKNVIPEHSLAQSIVLNKNTFPIVELDYRTAISYLRGETISLPSDTSTGYVLVCYKGHALGWLKNIGNRTNNLYPKEWRIRSLSVPDTCPVVLDI